MPSRPERANSPARPQRAAPVARAGRALKAEMAPDDAGLNNGPVTIGEASQLSGVSAKMLRYYESLGLLGKVTRSDSGYRLYSHADVHTLRFIKRSRDLGFSMDEISELVKLWQNRSRASSTVHKIAQKHLDDLSARIAAMQAMQRTLQNLLHHCHGDDRPDCPILDDLAGGTCTQTGCAHSA